MNKVPECKECEYVKMYNYRKRIYYCDNEDRTDDMGKLSVGDIPRVCPEWCPLREKINE